MYMRQCGYFSVIYVCLLFYLFIYFFATEGTLPQFVDSFLVSLTDLTHLVFFLLCIIYSYPIKKTENITCHWIHWINCEGEKIKRLKNRRNKLNQIPKRVTEARQFYTKSVYDWHMSYAYVCIEPICQHIVN